MSKRTNKFYRKNEAEVMRSLGLAPTKNSGSGWLEKEDGQSDHVIAQLKSTDKMSISIRIEDLNMLEYNAAVSHKIPVFMIQFLQTNETYLIVRPDNLPGLHELIETGTTTIVSSVDIAPDEQQDKIENKPKIKSGNRDKFWADKEKERSQWKRR